MMEALGFARLFLFHPARAAQACRGERALRHGLFVYVLCACASLLVAWIDPLRFLDPSAPVPLDHGVGFWLGVALWESAFFALSVFFMVLVLAWMREGWLPAKVMTAASWAAAPTALTMFASARGVGRLRFGALLALWAAPALLLARRAPRRRWREVGAFLLGLNAVQAVGLALETLLVAPARSITGFYVLNGVLLLWMLVVVGRGLSRLCETSAARVVLSFLLSVLLSLASPMLAWRLGLMSKEMLKILIYV